MLDVQIFQGKLLSRLMERHFFLQQHIQYRHQPGPVRAGFAMHQGRIFDRLEQVARRENRFACRRVAGEDLEVDQRNAGLFAGFLFKQVIALRKPWSCHTISRRARARPSRVERSAAMCLRFLRFALGVSFTMDPRA